MLLSSLFSLFLSFWLFISDASWHLYTSVIARDLFLLLILPLLRLLFLLLLLLLLLFLLLLPLLLLLP